MLMYNIEVKATKRLSGQQEISLHTNWVSVLTAPLISGILKDMTSNFSHVWDGKRLLCLRVWGYAGSIEILTWDILL